MRVLVTGATGTFGSAFLRRVLPWGWECRAFSRDEFKQGVLREEIPGARFLVGDVRDLGRLVRACRGVDVVVHAAALKQVESCEYNPDECIKTNVLGSMNVVEACLAAGVPQAVFLSSDKAVHPVNVYGASKLCAEKVWLASNALGQTTLSAVRYGNVRGSRGSVLEKQGPVVLTDRRATRFWMDVGEAVDLVLLAVSRMRGGEVFVPKLRSSRVADVVDSTGVEVGLRPGEKLHESLISDEEVPRTWDFGDHFRVLPEGYGPVEATRVGPDFRYSSEVVAA